MVRRSRFFLLGIFLTVGVAAAQTPTATLLNGWLAVFNSGDAGKLLTFWQTYGSGKPDAQVSRDLDLYGMTGGFTIVRIVQDSESRVVVSMKDRHKGFAEITLESTTGRPPKIKSITGHPVPPPKPERLPAANDQQLSEKASIHASELSAEGEFSGAVLIAHNGEPILQRAWGFADRGAKISSSINTQFCIGSMNKMFTAVAVLQLIAAHKLALNSTLADYWPDYPNHDLATRVTIRQLLNHTGGTGDIFTTEYEARRAETRTLADYVKLYGVRPVAFEPGSRFDYSNYGYILLGRLIEMVSGEDYFAYIQKHIAGPAGMFHTDMQSGDGTGFAEGYTRSGGNLKSNAATLPVAGTSAGGGYSTVGDLFLFSKALREGKLLPPDLLQQATSDQSHHGYGYGFNVSSDGSFGYGGGAPGLNGELRVLASGYTVIVLENLDPPSATEVADFIEASVPTIATGGKGLVKFASGEQSPIQ